MKNRKATIEYCSKGEVLASNVRSHKSSQLELAVQTLREKGMAAVAEEYPSQVILHARGLSALQSLWLSSRPKPVPKVSWYWGNTGSGKTRAAYESVNQDNIYWISPPNGKTSQLWFDGYCGQKVAVFDDFRPWWCTFSWLLQLLDRYPIQVPVKGGFVNWIPEHIIITTPNAPRETFSGAYRTDEEIEQLCRRIHEVKHFVVLASA